MKNIAIIGTGYVGLVAGAGLADLGNRVVCVDIDKDKIRSLQSGRMPFYEPGLEELISKNVREGRLSFTPSLSRGAKESHFIFIAVGTPTNQRGDRVDLSQVINVALSLVEAINEYKVIVVKSTVPIGTYEMVVNILDEKGKKEGVDFDIVFNPEFLREGNAVYDFFHPARLVIGARNKEIARAVGGLFNSLRCPRIFTSIVTAKLTKYAANAFLASRISFINEIANICDNVGADITTIIKGISYDKRIGKGYLAPGLGFGGPCLEKDLRGLINIGEDYGYEPNYLAAILEMNRHQLHQIINKIKESLGGTLYDKNIGILGLAFKAGTNDVRNSQAMRIVEILSHQGARIKAYDPEAITEAKKLVPAVIYAADSYAVCKDSQLLVILTDWPQFKNLDFQKIKSLMQKPVIVDGRNLYNPKEMSRLGFVYKGVGQT